MTQLEFLIPCASFAEWRSRRRGVGLEARNDIRAIVTLESLSAQLSALNGSPLHERLLRLREAEDDRSGERDRFSEIVAEELCAIGFTSFPATGKELLEKIAGHLETESRQWEAQTETSSKGMGMSASVAWRH
ncbi:MAG TPA: hypothetical protein VEH76_06915 [Methylocystis sp.]|nr:hypothetical protein [Methylocystis sp.]